MKKIWKIAKKWGSLAWKIIVIVGVIFGIWATYNQIFKKTSILSQIVSEVNVLDINEPLKDLQVIFQGDNIHEKNLNLKIYRVRIENTGETNITQDDFDQGDDWGIKVEKGRIIATRLVDFDSEYINENLSPQIWGNNQDNNIVKFKKIIFDKGNSFAIELLVLHGKDTPPVLYRIGKISGIQKNESEILALEHSEPFLATFFYGNLFVNSIRFFVYGLAAILILLVVLVVIIKLEEKRKKEAQSPQPPQQPS